MSEARGRVPLDWVGWCCPSNGRHSRCMFIILARTSRHSSRLQKNMDARYLVHGGDGLEQLACLRGRAWRAERSVSRTGRVSPVLQRRTAVEGRRRLCACCTKSRGHHESQRTRGAGAKERLSFTSAMRTFLRPVNGKQTTTLGQARQRLAVGVRKPLQDQQVRSHHP